MILVDAKGFSLAVSTGSASPHESGLIQELFGFMLSSELPERIIGDKAYDSDKLDAQLAAQGIEMIAPNRPTLLFGSGVVDFFRRAIAAPSPTACTLRDKL